jgi:hypothetical protein
MASHRRKQEQSPAAEPTSQTNEGTDCRELEPEQMMGTDSLP